MADEAEARLAEVSAAVAAPRAHPRLLRDLARALDDHQPGYLHPRRAPRVRRSQRLRRSPAEVSDGEPGRGGRARARGDPAPRRAVPLPAGARQRLRPLSRSSRRAGWARSTSWTASPSRGTAPGSSRPCGRFPRCSPSTSRACGRRRARLPSTSPGGVSHSMQSSGRSRLAGFDLLGYVRDARTKGGLESRSMVALRSSNRIAYPIWSGGGVTATLAVREVRLGGAPKPRLLDLVREAVRTRHFSRRTEKTYVAWIRRYVLFHGKRIPPRWARPRSAGF